MSNDDVIDKLENVVKNSSKYENYKYVIFTDTVLRVSDIQCMTDEHIIANSKVSSDIEHHEMLSKLGTFVNMFDDYTNMIKIFHDKENTAIATNIKLNYNICLSTEHPDKYLVYCHKDTDTTFYMELVDNGVRIQFHDTDTMFTALVIPGIKLTTSLIVDKNDIVRFTRSKIDAGELLFQKRSYYYNVQHSYITDTSRAAIKKLYKTAKYANHLHIDKHGMMNLAYEYDAVCNVIVSNTNANILRDINIALCTDMYTLYDDPCIIAHFKTDQVVDYHDLKDGATLISINMINYPWYVKVFKRILNI